MKLCVVVPGSEQLKQAGVRIRYQRITPFLKHKGIQLKITPVDELVDINSITDDIYIISKTYDVRALIVASNAKKKGKIVGYDLFDDYFSQSQDPRFSRLRSWIEQLSKFADLILCSTSTISKVAQYIAPTLPVHVLNDPYEGFNSKELEESINTRLQAFHCSKILTIGWFGIGDNPSFPIGLHDLVAFGEEVASLDKGEYSVQLKILTNMRALTGDNLQMLRSLPVPYTINEWSISKELELLQECLLCFLPVNCQNFSVVKSLNRAVSALTHGCNIISSGFPLYQPFDDFIYRNPIDFINDLSTNKLKLCKERIPQLEEHLNNIASPHVESSRLSEFLNLKFNQKNLISEPSYPDTIVVHGRVSSGVFHKFTQKAKALSVASPFCTANLNYDIRVNFDNTLKSFKCLVSNKITPFIVKEAKEHTQNYKKILARQYYTINSEHLESMGIPMSLYSLDLDYSFSISANYDQVLRRVFSILSYLFPKAEIILSEQSKDAWWFQQDQLFPQTEKAQDQ